MEIVPHIKDYIVRVLQDFGVQDQKEINLSIPEDLSHGDYTTNIAFQIAKELKKSPMEIAEKIAEKLTVLGSQVTEIKKVEAVKPGFVNFWLSEDYLVQEMQEMIKSPEQVGKTERQEGKKIMVEFTDPNPFKEFHIGHLYSNIVGESLCRLLESQGAEVKRVCYQGDVGLHVAKAIWGIQNHTAQIHEIEKKSLEEKAKFLGEAYALGATAYEENEEAKKEIIAINKKVYTQEDSEINELYKKGREWSLAQFDKIYERLGTTFWRFYFESEAGPIGLEYVNTYLAKGIFKKNDGAVIFEGEDYGLHTRVFINSQGLPTYEAKELGLAPTKYKDFPYDQSVILTGNEINEYFKVLLKVLSLVNPDLAKKTKHISHGMVRLPQGKMSSRTGNVITGESLLDEAIGKASKLSSHTEDLIDDNNVMTMSWKKSPSALNHGMVSSELRESTTQVAVGAVKYALLKSSIGKDIEFNFDTSISLEGNSGPYLQYTYVRTQSVLEKTKRFEAGYKTFGMNSGRMPAPASGYQLQPEENNLLRLANQFQSVVQESADTLSPSTLATYLYEIAKQFNIFYQTYRIADAKTPEEVSFRSQITDAIGLILKQGLFFLGIAAPKRM